MPKIIWSTVPSPHKNPLWTAHGDTCCAVSWKKYLEEDCPHGLRIVLVDGAHVRNTWESDFSQGGNGYAFGFIPRSEIWIDWNIAKEEWPFIAYHECIEVEAMKKGFTYNQAHIFAKGREDRYRHELTNPSQPLRNPVPRHKNPPKKTYPKLTNQVQKLASKYIAEEIETGQYPRKQAIAIGISRAKAKIKKSRGRR